MVKDYESQQDKRNAKVAREDEHSKVLNMLSIESYESKRKAVPVKSNYDSFNNSQIGDRYITET